MTTYPGRAGGRPRSGQDVRELKRQLEDEARELAERGVCGCGCGGELSKGGNGRRVFRDGHRQRFRRRMLKRLAEASGVPATLSLKTLQATETTGDRNGDAQTGGKRPRRAPRPGVTIYLPTVELAAAVRAAAQRAAFELEGDARDELERGASAINDAIGRRLKRARRPAA